MENSLHDSDTVQHHLGPFLTWVAERRSQRRTLLYTSRRKRKGLAPLVLTSEKIDPLAAILEVRHRWNHFWAPRRIGWWVGVLFMFGSALFAIGGAMGTWPEMPFIRSIDQSHIGWIFFIGRQGNAGVCTRSVAFLRLATAQYRLRGGCGSADRNALIQCEHRGRDDLRPELGR